MTRSHHDTPTAPATPTGLPLRSGYPATVRPDAPELVGRVSQRRARRLLGVMDMDLAQRMLDVVARIPSGKVATYGDIAARAGSRSPRLAGFVLAQLSDESHPWHRVLRADGTPAPHLANEQLNRLRSEGVDNVDGRVNLRVFRWHDD